MISRQPYPLKAHYVEILNQRRKKKCLNKLNKQTLFVFLNEKTESTNWP